MIAAVALEPGEAALRVATGQEALELAGEPATRVEFDISWRGDAPCLDVALDCTDGRSCVTFEDADYPERTCGETCDSIYLGCG